MRLFRYPGGKTKIKKHIFDHLHYTLRGSDVIEYREPFFGGGSIGIDFIKKYVLNVWINDIDIGIACLWKAVICCPHQLNFYVKNIYPSTENFFQYKKQLLSLTEMPLSINQIVQIGFYKLAIHQMSYSGLGTKSGSPLGGKKQTSKYKIDCRWNAEKICSKILSLHNLFKKSNVKTCTNKSFEELIKDISCPALLYLDPPYYHKGNELYQHGFSQSNHEALCSLLKQTEHKWVLSYDDCPEIKKMYSWATITEIPDVNYTVTARKTKKNELIITK